MRKEKVRWVKQHTVINGHRLTFTGTGASLIGQWIVNEILCVITCGIYSFSGAGIALLGEYIIIFVLTLITFGIYSSWGEVRLNKFLVRHTDFVN